MRHVLNLLAVCSFATVCHAADPKTILLWPDGAPQAVGTEDRDKPSLLLYPAPADKATGACVIVAPGGGYNVLAIDHEGQQVARWFNSFGVSAVVLRYRLKPKYQPITALLDGKRAVRWVRANAKELNADPKRIGMLGFSAGAHLTASVAIENDAGKADATDPVEKESCRPDYTFFIYGGATAVGDPKSFGPNDPPGPGFTKDSPPVFLMCSNMDSLLPRALETYKALQAAKVDTEVHIYGGWGPHGLGMAPGEPGLGTWPDLARTWMRRMNYLTDQARASIKGKLTLDGEPVNRAWVTLIPLDNPNAPIAATHFGQNYKGAYKLDEKFGPIPGKYRVEIRIHAHKFTDFPSIDDVLLLTKLTPAGEEMRVEVKPGENEFNFDLKTK